MASTFAKHLEETAGLFLWSFQRLEVPLRVVVKKVAQSWLMSLVYLMSAHTVERFQQRVIVAHLYRLESCCHCHGLNS